MDSPHDFQELVGILAGKAWPFRERTDTWTNVSQCARRRLATTRYLERVRGLCKYIAQINELPRALIEEERMDGRLAEAAARGDSAWVQNPPTALHVPGRLLRHRSQC